MTAAPEVLSLLATSGLPPEAQAFLAAVSEGEVPTVAGQSAFNILYSGGTLVATNPNVVTIGRWRYWTGPLAAFPAWGGAKLASGLISTAAGFCQDTHTTFEDNAGFGITAFDPQSQIIFNWKLAQQRFAARYGSAAGSLLSVLQGSSADRMLVHTYLGPTWPGGCDSGFVKRYAANLAALQAPAPPPAPVPVPAPPTPDTYTGTLTDSSGKSLPVSITIGAAAMILGAIVMAPKPSQPPIQALPLPAAAEAPIGQEVMRGFDFSGSTFVFDKNLRPVPISSGMGR